MDDYREDEYELWDKLQVRVQGVSRLTLAGGKSSYRDVLASNVFLLTCSGKALLHVDEGVQALEPFFMLHLRQGACIKITAREPFESFILSYRATPPVWRRWTQGVAYPPPFSFAPAQPLALYELLDRMNRIRGASGKEKLLLKSLFYRFIAEMLQQRQLSEPRQPELKRQVIDYLQEHFDRSHTLESLGQACGYNPRYLARRFKKETGLSPIDYLIRIRLGKACELLCRTSATIGEIAQSVGYDDMFYFNRLFKKNLGCSPGRYRQDPSKQVPFSPYEGYGLSMEGFVFPWYSVNDNENQYHSHLGGERNMSRTNKTMSLLLGLTLLLTACGGGGASEKAAGASPGQSPSAGPSASLAPKVGAKQEAQQQPTTKKVNTLFGELEVPSKPMRIAAIQYVSSIMAVGVQPIASTNRVLDNPYFEGLKDGIELVGTSSSDISFEKLIALEPDLIILMTSDRQEYENYSKIAPTISIPWGAFQTIQEEVLFFGDLLGRAEEARQWVDEYEERIALSKAKVDAAIPEDATFSIFQWSDKSLSLYGEGMGRGGVPIYRNLERTMPESYADDLKKEGDYRRVSLEVLQELAGDYIFLTTESSLEEIENDPIWSKVDAVKNGRTYVWRNERSYFNDPLSVLMQTEELADWLVGSVK